MLFTQRTRIREIYVNHPNIGKEFLRIFFGINNDARLIMLILCIQKQVKMYLKVGLIAMYIVDYLYLNHSYYDTCVIDT